MKTREEIIEIMKKREQELIKKGVIEGTPSPEELNDEQSDLMEFEKNSSINNSITEKIENTNEKTEKNENTLSKKNKKPTILWMKVVDKLVDNGDKYMYNSFRDRLMIYDEKIKNWRYAIEKEDIQGIFRTLSENPNITKNNLSRAEIYRELVYQCIKTGQVLNIMQQIPEWDGEDHIGKLLRTVELTNEYKRPLFENIMRKWLIGLVACASNTESSEKLVDNAIMPIFYSEKEGIGKTRWFTEIAEKAFGNDYFGYAPIDKYERDLALCSKILLLYDEVKITQKTADVLKAQLTATKIDIRKKYEAISEQHIRKASLCGTTNKWEALSELAVNRRFCIFNVKQCNWYNNGINYPQVIAQAKYLWKNGEPYYLDESLIEENKEIALIHTDSSLAHDKLKENLGNFKMIFKNISEVADYIGLRIVTKQDYKDLSEAINFYGKRQKNNKIVLYLKEDNLIKEANKILDELANTGALFDKKENIYNMYKEHKWAIHISRVLRSMPEAINYNIVRKKIKSKNKYQIKHKKDIKETDEIENTLI